MDSAHKDNEIGTVMVNEARKRFQSNPLAYITVILGIVVVFFPFVWWLFTWLFPVTDTLSVSDLESLRKDLETVRESYRKVQNTVDKIVSEESYRWKLPEPDRKLLQKLSQEPPSWIMDIARFIYFLLQGTFFFLLGVWIERKLLSPRRASNGLKEKENIPVSPQAVTESTPASPEIEEITEMETMSEESVPKSSSENQNVPQNQSISQSEDIPQGQGIAPQQIKQDVAPTPNSGNLEKEKQDVASPQNLSDQNRPSEPPNQGQI